VSSLRLLTRSSKRSTPSARSTAGADGQTLRVGHQRVAADDVDVTLRELAEAAAPGRLGAPHRGDVIALERFDEVAVHADDAGERHREVVAQRDVALAVVEEPVEQLVALVAVLAEQDVGVLERRRAQRREAERLEDAGDLVEHALAGEHHIGQIVAKTAQDARFDGGHGGDPLSGLREGGMGMGDGPQVALGDLAPGSTQRASPAPGEEAEQAAGEERRRDRR
jgi:hypothetical protein